MSGWGVTSARQEQYMSPLMTIKLDDLACVSAGSDSSLGRCGPGTSWPWLGNVHTDACLAHDRAVDDHMARGDSYGMAFVKSLPKLPAAVGSYIGARVRDRIKHP